MVAVVAITLNERATCLVHRRNVYREIPISRRSHSSSLVLNYSTALSFTMVLYWSQFDPFFMANFLTLTER